MSDPGRRQASSETESSGSYSPNTESPETEPEYESPQGPSLTLLYSLIALALALAIGFATMIVLPFHNRR